MAERPLRAPPEPYQYVSFVAGDPPAIYAELRFYLMSGQNLAEAYDLFDEQWRGQYRQLKQFLDPNEIPKGRSDT